MRRLPIAILAVVMSAIAAIAFFVLAALPDIPERPPTEADDEFGTVEVYTVLDDGTLDPQPTGLRAEVWETFLRVATAEFATSVVDQYLVGDSPDSDTLAYVFQTRNPENWVLADNLATSGNRDDLVATLVHEYGHILTLGVDEVDPHAATCPTLDLDEGCADTDSAIWAFEQQFWSGYGEEAPATDNVDEDIAYDFYLAHEEDFVDDYAATNVVEDIAETFMTWVVEDSPEGDSVVAQKLAFFEDYPSLVEIRDRIRAEFDL